MLPAKQQIQKWGTNRLRLVQTRETLSLSDPGPFRRFRYSGHIMSMVHCKTVQNRRFKRHLKQFNAHESWSIDQSIFFWLRSQYLHSWHVSTCSWISPDFSTMHPIFRLIHTHTSNIKYHDSSSKPHKLSKVSWFVFIDLWFWGLYHLDNINGVQINHIYLLFQISNYHLFMDFP